MLLEPCYKHAVYFKICSRWQPLSTSSKKHNSVGSIVICVFSRDGKNAIHETGSHWLKSFFLTSTIASWIELSNRPRRLGYPIFSARVFRVIQNSGNENCYPILPPKKHYPQIRVPDNSGSGSGITRYTQIYRKQPTILNFSSDLYIISAAICIEFQ